MKSIKVVEVIINPLSTDTFRSIFTEQFNISFKSPKWDTYAKCDEYAVAIGSARKYGNEGRLAQIKNCICVKQNLQKPC